MSEFNVKEALQELVDRQDHIESIVTFVKTKAGNYVLCTPPNVDKKMLERLADMIENEIDDF